MSKKKTINPKKTSQSSVGKNDNSHFDLVIIGGGMAGSSMALMLTRALSKLQLKRKARIAIIERSPYLINSRPNLQQASFDERCIALSWSSRLIFERMGIWSDLAATSTDNEQAAVIEPILKIEVSDQGKFGTTRLDSEEENVEALGYVVESRALGKVLNEQLKAFDEVSYFCPASIEQMILPKSWQDGPVQIHLNSEDQSLEISTELVIAADGGKSIGHQFLSQAPKVDAYGQSAIITNVVCQYPHENIAYERFTPRGPLAFLPLTQDRCSVVWTVLDSEVDKIMRLSDSEFLQQLEQQFGQRMGPIIRSGERVAYPLALIQIDPEQAKQCPRLVMIGNAAHSVHPVAGQGFNLGLRDIAVLSHLIEQNIQQSGQFSFEQSLVENYWQQRQGDIKRVSQLTNSLIKIFSNEQFPWMPSRDIGLVLANIVPPIKRQIARQAMGLNSMALD